MARHSTSHIWSHTWSTIEAMQSLSMLASLFLLKICNCFFFNELTKRTHSLSLHIMCTRLHIMKLGVTIESTHGCFWHGLFLLSFCWLMAKFLPLRWFLIVSTSRDRHIWFVDEFFTVSEVMWWWQCLFVVLCWLPQLFKNLWLTEIDEINYEFSRLGYSWLHYCLCCCGRSFCLKKRFCVILATVGCMNTAPHTTDILVLPQPSSAPMGLNCTDKLNFTCITSLEFYANEVNGGIKCHFFVFYCHRYPQIQAVI